MNNQLQETNNEAEFNMNLNRIMGVDSSNVTPPKIYFKSKDGIFVFYPGEKDTNGESISEIIGKQLLIHVVAVRKNFEGKDEETYWARNFMQHGIVKVMNEGNVVFHGSEDKLNEKDANGEYINDIRNYLKPTYSFYGYIKKDDKEIMVEFINSGTMISKMFEYLSSFKNDSCGNYFTKVSPGEKVTKKMAKGTNIYHETVYTKLANAEGVFFKVPQASIIKRAVEVKQYLDAVSRNEMASWESQATKINEKEVTKAILGDTVEEVKEEECITPSLESEAVPASTPAEYVNKAMNAVTEGKSDETVDKEITDQVVNVPF